MNRKKVKKLKVISFVLIFLLVCECIYVGYHLLFKSEKSVYFEGVNAIEYADKYFITVGSNNDNELFFEKAKISKYNNKREKTFEKLYNVGFNSSFFGVAIDGTDFVTVGSYEKTERDHEELIRRAIIVKYDKEGNVLFEKDFSLLDNSKFTSVLVVDDGYYVTGQSVYRNTRVGNKEGGAILAKYSKEGELLWYRTYGSNKSAIFNDFIVYNNSIYTVGTDDDYIGIIVQYDLDGNYISYNDYHTTDSLGFSGITAYGDFIYICGALRRSNNDTDGMIVRYNLDCVYLDQVVYTGDGIERFNKVLMDDQEHLVVIGTMAIAKEQGGITEYNYDGILAKYDLDLKKIDSISYGADRDDYFTDILYHDNEYLVAGYSYYEDGSYMSKFIRYSKALKVLGVE
ncbi:MAG: hypothetical protein IKF71_05300 [Bacilli bacterium]|nr:hypothetical protein [Bacilli bacterium]